MEQPIRPQRYTRSYNLTQRHPKIQKIGKIVLVKKEHIKFILKNIHSNNIQTELGCNIFVNMYIYACNNNVKKVAINLVESKERGVEPFIGRKGKRI